MIRRGAVRRVARQAIAPGLDLSGTTEAISRPTATCAERPGAHPGDRATEHDYGPPYGVRTVWRCDQCGRVRGRCP